MVEPSWVKHEIIVSLWYGYETNSFSVWVQDKRLWV